EPQAQPPARRARPRAGRREGRDAGTARARVGAAPLGAHRADPGHQTGRLPAGEPRRSRHRAERGGGAADRRSGTGRGGRALRPRRDAHGQRLARGRFAALRWRLTAAVTWSLTRAIRAFAFDWVSEPAATRASITDFLAATIASIRPAADLPLVELAISARDLPDCSWWRSSELGTPRYPAAVASGPLFSRWSAVPAVTAARVPPARIATTATTAKSFCLALRFIFP